MYFWKPEPKSNTYTLNPGLHFICQSPSSGAGCHNSWCLCCTSLADTLLHPHLLCCLACYPMELNPLPRKKKCYSLFSCGICNWDVRSTTVRCAPEAEQGKWQDTRTWEETAGGIGTLSKQMFWLKCPPPSLSNRYCEPLHRCPLLNKYTEDLGACFSKTVSLTVKIKNGLCA